MRLPWPLPEQLSTMPALRMARVVIFYDGPQVALWSMNDTTLLAVASDDDEHGVRWLGAPVSQTEMTALADGATDVRAVLQKDGLFAFDVDHSDRPLHVWEMSGIELGDDFLPAGGTPLPLDVRALLGHQPATKPEIRLDPSVGDVVSFRALGEILTVFQRLWSSISEVVFGESAHVSGAWTKELVEHSLLSLRSAAPGSLVLSVSMRDDTSFESVARHFESLVGAGADSTRLAPLFARLGPRVQGRYGELLERLRKHAVSMLSRRVDGAAFLPNYGAARVLSAFPVQLQETMRAPVVINGSFVMFDVGRASFTFRTVEDDDADSYVGTVDPAVIQKYSKISVGPGAIYRASILTMWHSLGGGQTQVSHVLTEAVPIGDGES